jgi:hypothetical protein
MFREERGSHEPGNAVPLCSVCLLLFICVFIPASKRGLEITRTLQTVMYKTVEIFYSVI